MVVDTPSSELEQSVKDFAELSNEYAVRQDEEQTWSKVLFFISCFLLEDLEELHNEYRTKLQEVHGLQKKCLAAVNHQK